MLPRPKALFIAPAMPALGGNGLAMRLGIFLEALAETAETELLLLPVAGAADADPALAESLDIPVTTIPVAGRVETHFAMLSRLRDPAARAQAFRHYGRGSLEAHLSAPVLDDIRRFGEGRRYDLVHVGRAYLMRGGLAAAAGSGLSVDLDEDDGWSWRRAAAVASAAGDADAADWAKIEAAAADRSLAELHPNFAASFVSGPVDAARLRRRHRGLRPKVVENAVTTGPLPERRDNGHTLLFVGSFGYAPNVDGLMWFVERIWPAIRAGSAAPLRLRLVGRDMPETITSLARDPAIEVLGAVPALAPLYAEATLALAPLRAGGGTRIKLIEAAAQGVPIVSTALAARGLAFADTRGMWLADTEAAFAAAVLAALAAPAEREKRAGVARRAVVARYDRQKVVARLACRFAETLAR